MGGIRVAAAPVCMKWSQPPVPHSPSSSQTLASAISSPKRRSLSSENGALICRSVFLGSSHSKLHRTGSWEQPPKLKFCTKTRRSCSASMDSFSDEEFSKRLQELSSKFQLSDEDIEISGEKGTENGPEAIVVENRLNFDPLRPPDWPSEIQRDGNIPVGIERRANSVELPLSLRIIKRKKQWDEGFREAGESAYCSVKKAFSSMVFIIRELQSYTLQMREMLFYEDLQGILVRVQKEMNASFVWLFQQVFSHTPTLMVYVMILLANYSVHSIANNPAMAMTMNQQQGYPAGMESVSEVLDFQNDGSYKFGSLSVKSFTLPSSLGKAASVGGSNGWGGGNQRPSASGTDGDGMFDRPSTVVPDGASSAPSRNTEKESVSGQVSWEEEMSLWNKFVEEASKMQSALRDESLDHETMQRFVSPVNAKIDGDDQAEYFKTELLYQTGLAQEPLNTLLLANYAQFLYLVIQDYDRAESYFKKAVKVEPKDAEAYNKYANFLWQVRKDLWAAEETYLEAISADPSNSYYAANYAHFLWSTGGEDTCFPLDDSPETEADSQW